MNYEDEVLIENYPFNSFNINNRINKKKKCKVLNLNKILIFFCFLFLLCILGFQIINYLYMNSIIHIVKEVKISEFNITRTKEYLNKTETIVDFLCYKYIKC